MTDWSVIINASENRQSHIAVTAGIGSSRHCERSEAIHLTTQRKKWIASRTLSSGGASRRPGGSQ
jgi:hypothetical protein